MDEEQTRQKMLAMFDPAQNTAIPEPNEASEEFIRDGGYEDLDTVESVILIMKSCAEFYEELGRQMRQRADDENLAACLQGLTDAKGFAEYNIRQLTPLLAHYGIMVVTPELIRKIRDSSRGLAPPGKGSEN